MVRNARLPSAEVVRELHEQGMSMREIGNRYAVTNEAVRQKLQSVGVRTGNRNDHSHYLPWRLRADHSHDVIAKRLRAYSKQQQGVQLPDDEARKLVKFMEFMDGANPVGVALSVHYDRLDAEGFWLEPRQPGDRDYISPPTAAAL